MLPKVNRLSIGSAVRCIICTYMTKTRKHKKLASLEISWRSANVKRTMEEHWHTRLSLLNHLKTVYLPSEKQLELMSSMKKIARAISQLFLMAPFQSEMVSSSFALVFDLKERKTPILYKIPNQGALITKDKLQEVMQWQAEKHMPKEKCTAPTLS